MDPATIAMIASTALQASQSGKGGGGRNVQTAGPVTGFSAPGGPLNQGGMASPLASPLGDVTSPADTPPQKPGEDEENKKKETLISIFKMLKDPDVQNLLGLRDDRSRAQTAAPIAGGASMGMNPSFALPGGAGMSIGALLNQIPRIS